MPIPGMTPEVEQAARDLGMRYCVTYLQWLREKKGETDLELKLAIQKALYRIRKGDLSPAELGDIWVVLAGETFNYEARSEKDHNRLRFGLVPRDKEN